MSGRWAMGSLAVSAAIWAAAGLCAGDEQPANFKCSTRRDNDHLKVTVENGKTLISVTSPAGISGATIKRQDAAWPKVIVLRLHLAGLENFRATCGNASLVASVSSSGGTPRPRLAGRPRKHAAGRQKPAVDRDSAHEQRRKAGHRDSARRRLFRDRIAAGMFCRQRGQARDRMDRFLSQLAIDHA